mgnify:FL=1
MKQIILDQNAARAIQAYLSNVKSYDKKLDHIYTLRRKADEIEDRADKLASGLRSARAEHKAARDAYAKTADMAPVTETIQRVKTLEAELSLVAELEPVARKAADDAARSEFIGQPRIPYEAVAVCILDSMPPDLGLALFCLQKAYGRLKVQEGSARWALLVDKLTAKQDQYDSTLREILDSVPS